MFLSDSDYRGKIYKQFYLRWFMKIKFNASQIFDMITNPICSLTPQGRLECEDYIVQVNAMKKAGSDIPLGEDQLLSKSMVFSNHYINLKNKILPFPFEKIDPRIILKGGCWNINNTISMNPWTPATQLQEMYRSISDSLRKNNENWVELSPYMPNGYFLKNKKPFMEICKEDSGSNHLDINLGRDENKIQSLVSGDEMQRLIKIGEFNEDINFMEGVLNDILNTGIAFVNPDLFEKTKDLERVIGSQEFLFL